MNIFSDGITYLEGGVDSGFRKVSDDDDDLNIQRLYRVYKKKGEQTPRCFEVALKCSSLNDSDAFLLDAGSKIYTWFGTNVSAFEKSKSATVAHNIKQTRLGSCECILDVEDDNEEFWEILGGKGEVKAAAEETSVDDVSSESLEKKMYIVSDTSGPVKVTEVPFSRRSLTSNDVFIIDTIKDVHVWIGKDSSSAEKHQAMLISYRYLKAMGRYDSTCVTRVLEDQEDRCTPFLEVF